jgi:predicted nucleic acid-binding protein
MKFWDSSALVPLCVTEPTSAAMRALLDRDPMIVAWWSTPIECLSGLLRRSRDGSLSGLEVAQARAVLRALAESWVEVSPSEAVRVAAERALAAHDLRAADSLQLAAALVWMDRDARGAGFVSFDTRLREAALREGFDVLPRSI